MTLFEFVLKKLALSFLFLLSTNIFLLCTFTDLSLTLTLILEQIHGSMLCEISMKLCKERLQISFKRSSRLRGKIFVRAEQIVPVHYLQKINFCV